MFRILYLQLLYTTSTLFLESVLAYARKYHLFYTYVHVQN